MVDAKDQSAKLCAMELGSEVQDFDLSSRSEQFFKQHRRVSHLKKMKWFYSMLRMSNPALCFFCLSVQKQFSSHLDELIEESVKDMIQLLVAKVWLQRRTVAVNLRKKQANHMLSLAVLLLVMVTMCHFLFVHQFWVLFYPWLRWGSLKKSTTTTTLL